MQATTRPETLTDRPSGATDDQDRAEQPAGQLSLVEQAVPEDS